MIVSGGNSQAGSVEDALKTMKLVYQIYWADATWRDARNIQNPNSQTH